jgi:hypothetical protein
MKDVLLHILSASIGLLGAVLVAIINNAFIGRKFKKLTTNHFHSLGGYLRLLNSVFKRVNIIDDKELEELNQQAAAIGTL